jgi:hypothetical protein
MKKGLILVALIVVLASAALVFAGMKPATVKGIQTECCVEIDVESSPEVYIGDNWWFSAEITNCGDDPAFIQIRGTVDVPFVPNPIPFAMRPVHLGAGETQANSWEFEAPFWLPVGTYTICLTALVGDPEAPDCEATDCASTELLEAP